MVPLTKC
jgi:hypothetical protein